MVMTLCCHLIEMLHIVQLFSNGKLTRKTRMDEMVKEKGIIWTRRIGKAKFHKFNIEFEKTESSSMFSKNIDFFLACIRLELYCKSHKYR